MRHSGTIKRNGNTPLRTAIISNVALYRALQRLVAHFKLKLLLCHSLGALWWLLVKTYQRQSTLCHSVLLQNQVQKDQQRSSLVKAGCALRDWILLLQCL